MFASTEYLLAGLPIVTTASAGGRDVYHDAEYCWTVPADPAAVADAVDHLKARNIPRRYIRERTLRTGSKLRCIAPDQSRRRVQITNQPLLDRAAHHNERPLQRRANVFDRTTLVA